MGDPAPIEDQTQPEGRSAEEWIEHLTSKMIDEGTPPTEAALTANTYVMVWGMHSAFLKLGQSPFGKGLLRRLAG